MQKSLVIVESPAKAKTINKYLGPQFIVKSSIGHIRDLPTGSRRNTMSAQERAKLAQESKKLSKQEREQLKQKRQQQALIERMGIDPEHGWKPRYEILPGKEKVVAELKKLAKNAETVYLATDLDREGEAIAWHLKETIKHKNIDFKRVIFNEITKDAIQHAFSSPGDLNLNQVNAQQTRRFLDRVVGYMVSPLLWKKIARGLSAGRVQSVAVRLIVEREKEIHAFIPEEYWEVQVDLFTSKKISFRAQVTKEQLEGREVKFLPKNKAQTDKAVEILQTARYQLLNKETRPNTSKAKPPFITSTLQQAASTRLGFGVKKTMMLAQRLYEAGYITYMRTDSTNLSQDALDAARNYIEKEFGSRYLPEKPIFYASGKAAQEAHEAIRPTDVKVESALLKGIDSDGIRLYDLIWRQFLACQMTAAKYENTTLTIQADRFILKAKGRTLIFDGWTRLLRALGKGSDDIILPEIQIGETLSLSQLLPSQHFTKPPARYSEASLVKELEKRGIGRPSTYANIISTIQERGYVSIKNRRFYAEKIGEIVVERLIESFTDLMNYNFTAEMEDKLDQIAEGKNEWKAVLDDFYKDFKNQLIQADRDDDKGMRQNMPIPTDINCPACGRKMNIRIGSTGVFLGCSGYSLPPKERCKETINLVPGDEVVDVDKDEEGEAKALMERPRCPKCDTSMNSYLVDEKHKLHVCGNSPDCEGVVIEEGSFKLAGYDGPEIECDKCGSQMQLLSGRFGKYFSCTDKDCGNTRKLLANGEPAPPKAEPVHMKEIPCKKSDGYFILRDGAAGLFMASSLFPKSRETRAPLVKELIAHKDELDPKFLYLCEAPTEDDKGNPVMIRFSRKNKQQYIMTEDENGKATGWVGYYRDGQWDISKPEKKKTSRKKAVKKK